MGQDDRRRLSIKEQFPVPLPPQPQGRPRRAGNSARRPRAVWQYLVKREKSPYGCLLLGSQTWQHEVRRMTFRPDPGGVGLFVLTLAWAQSALARVARSLQRQFRHL